MAHAIGRRGFLFAAGATLLYGAGATSRSTDVMLKGGGAGGGGGAVGGVGAMITGGAPLLCAESLPHALKENTIPSANKLNFGFPPSCRRSVGGDGRLKAAAAEMMASVS